MDQKMLALLGRTFILVATAGVLAMLELWGSSLTKARYCV